MSYNNYSHPRYHIIAPPPPHLMFPPPLINIPVKPNPNIRPTISPQAQALKNAFNLEESPAQAETVQSQKSAEFVNLFIQLSTLTEPIKPEVKYLIGSVVNNRRVYTINELFKARDHEASKKEPTLLINSKFLCLKQKKREYVKLKPSAHAWTSFEDRAKTLNTESKQLLYSKSQIQRAINKFSQNTQEIAIKEITLVPVKDLNMARYLVDCIYETSKDTIYSRELAHACITLSKFYNTTYDFNEILISKFLQGIKMSDEFLSVYNRLKTAKISTVQDLDAINEELQTIERVQRQRMLGCAKFLAELYNVKIIKNEKMLEFIKSFKLINDLDIEMTCVYLTVIHYNIPPNSPAIKIIERIKNTLKTNKKTYGMRVQFIIEDLLKLEFTKQKSIEFAPDKKMNKPKITISDVKNIDVKKVEKRVEKKPEKIVFDITQAEKLLNDPFKSFAITNDIPRFIDDLKDIEVSNHMHLFILFAFNFLIDNSKLNHLYLGQLIVTLISSGNLTARDLKTGLSEFCENLEDNMIDLPNLPDYIAAALIPSIITENFDVKTYFEILKPEVKQLCITKFFNVLLNSTTVGICRRIYEKAGISEHDLKEGLNVNFITEDILYLPLIMPSKYDPGVIEEFVRVTHTLCPPFPMKMVESYLDKVVQRNLNPIKIFFSIEVNINHFYDYLDKYLSSRKNMPLKFISYFTQSLLHHKLLDISFVETVTKNIKNFNQR